VNIIDSVLLLLICLFGLRGYFKGLFRETCSLLGLFVGFIVGVRYDETAAALWRAHWEIPPIALKALAFVSLFAAVYLTFCLAGWLLHRFAPLFLLQRFNRVGGLLVGAGKGVAVLALALFFVKSSSLAPRSMVQKINESYLAAPLFQVADGIIRTGRATLLAEDQLLKREGEHPNSL
jgi:membrane protein required for colicin V production